MIDGNKYTKEDFRKYVLTLEKHYMSEYERVKDHKPFAAEPEKRMSLLCGHILENYDAIDT